MLRIETALVRTRVPGLGQRRDAMHAGEQRAHVLSTGIRRGLAAWLVKVSEPSDAVGARPPIGDDRRFLFDVLRHERHDRIGRSLVEHTHGAPSKTMRLPQLECHADQDLLGFVATTAETPLLSAEVGLVDLDGAREPVTPGAHEHRPQTLQHRPGGLVRADLEGALKAECRYTALCRGGLAAGREPHPKHRPGPVEDRPRGHRGPATVCSTLDPSIAQPPALVMAALVAHEATAPPEPCQVVDARRVRAAPRPQLTGRPRVVSATSSRSRLASSFRLDGAP